MNWRDIEWNIVTLGRLAAIGIVVAGVVLAALDASAFNLGPAHGDRWFRFRYFLGGAIGYAWLGGLIFAVAEIASRLGWPEREAFGWRGRQVLIYVGLLVTIAGIALNAWSVYQERHFASVSDLTRVHMHSVITSFWEGSVLLLAAAIADRISWTDATEEEPALEAPA